MRKLFIYIEILGQEKLVGSITGNDTGDAQFTYAPEYLDIKEAEPISISLPLQTETFDSSRTCAFFEGLLPEGFTRRSVANWAHIDAGDYLAILAELGQECLGALRIRAEESETIPAAYEPLDMEQVKALAAEGATKCAELVNAAHLSLTGASGKVGLYYDEKADRWYLPKGDAPSTHIVKQSHVRLDSIVTNEQLIMKTAAKCGLATPKSFILNAGVGRDQDVLFATERYDRVIPADPVRISGLPRPLRLHQEDFAQALAIPARLKYENPASKDGSESYFRRMFDLLSKHSANPVEDQIRLWDAIVFDYLAGNADNHLKNVSLLYGSNLKNIRLAPIYDIVCTSVYPGNPRNMAVGIGGDFLLESITRESFARAAETAGIGRGMAMKRLDVIVGQFEDAINQSAAELNELGFEKASELRERVLSSGGYKHI